MRLGTRLIFLKVQRKVPPDATLAWSAHMNWAIQQQAEAIDSASFDGSAWKWRLRDAKRERLLVFQVTGTAMCMSDDALPRGGSLARTSSGLSEVEQVLAWDTPPDVIEVSSVSIRRWGGAREPSAR